MDNELFVPNAFSNSLSDVAINSSSFKGVRPIKRKAPFEFSPQASFKKRINFFIHFFDSHSTLFSFTKIIIGVIFIATPTLMIILYPFYSHAISISFYMLPFIISVAISNSFLIIFIITRIINSLQSKGTILYSWNRANVFKIVYIIFISFFILWTLKEIESYLIAFPKLGEYIYQTCANEKETNINLNMFLVNIIFASNIWNEQLKCGEGQVHTFNIEQYTITLHKDSLNKIVNAALTLSILYFVKVVLFKTKNEKFYFIIMPMMIYECVLFKLYCKNKYQFQSRKIFYKIIELAPIVVVIICGMCLAVKRYIVKIFKKKYKTFLTHKLNWLSLVSVIASFVLVFCSLVMTLVVIIYALIKFDFDMNMDYGVINKIKNGCWISLISFLFGNVFMFGHSALDLIFKPNVYEGFRAVLKNPHYIKVSSKRLRNNNKIQI